ncbi:MAG: VirB4 family type IV secretion system protein [Candidatus Bilamarchaeum sp.]
MAYDIPDEIRYKEKIIANLDLMQLLYCIAFGLTAYFAYKLPIEGDVKFIIQSIILIIGFAVVFLKFDEKLRDILSYYCGLRRAANNSKPAQKFFEVKFIKDNLIHLDDGQAIAIIEIQPLNFNLLDQERRKSILTNYKSFLNQLTSPIQVIIRTKSVNLKEYFEKVENTGFQDRKLLLSIYLDFRVFEENFLDNHEIKERKCYIAIPSKQGELQAFQRLSESVEINIEKLRSCSLESRRLMDSELLDLLRTYADNGVQEKEIESKAEDVSTDQFRNILTPSFDIRKDRAIINGEFHRIIKTVGYPREVEDGWLQTFLAKNDNYDISMHIVPSTINSMLVYLHNQIIQQTSDLLLSTSKGTPNPSLEIKKADTMRVYDALYKGKEKLFSVSLYVDTKTPNIEELELLTDKCKSNLNSQLMIPQVTNWRMADGIKSTLPLVKDNLEAKRDFMTESLSATFPFISSVDTRKKGILFGHDIQTLNPVFIDFERMSNKHFFVIGISGSGKSYTSKYLIMQQLFKEETLTFILDPNGEYSSLCQALEGKVVELSRDSNSIINLFDLAGEDFGGKMLSLISAFDIIVGGLTESQKGVLNKALTKAYSKRGITYDCPETWDAFPPTFSDIRDALLEIRKESSERQSYIQDPSIEALLNRVEMYCEGGIFGFLDTQSRIDLSSGFICFDLSKLPNAVKTLMMFATLELINREIKKNKKPKVVLIDEGWSLLRSKEAAAYILEFVKTSRKFNTSMGFVTQEMEDLLHSKTGKSILNTASVKILMRQNPTNIELISSALRLNEHAQNYLLTASSGQGLLITEQNIQKFFVKTSEKLHNLITTNPNESSDRPKKVEKTRKNPPIDLGKGIYIRSELKEGEEPYLMQNGYRLFKGRLEQRGGSSHYLVKIRHNESAEHSFFCWKVYYLLKESFGNAKLSTTSSGDVSTQVNNRKIAFEIETGYNLSRDSEEEVTRRFLATKEAYDDFYILVTNSNLKSAYAHLGKVITRNELATLINKLGQPHILAEEQPSKNERIKA